ncbi:MAG TPA: neutral/alkaline non-lysosomal ceramidase N-terminal domain-containing protein, partial [Anaerolineae bacterium]
MNHDVMCGAGRVDITIPAGTPMGGYANRASTCQGVLDPLSVRALLLRTDHAALLILALDALAISAQRARQLAEDAAQASEGAVQAECVRVACSHTHSGADLSGMFGDAALIGRYFEQVRNSARAATRQALDSLTPALIRQGAADFPIGKNRRLRPGHAHVSALERSQGEQIDHTLTALRFERPHTGRIIATLFHTACHPVCLGPENVRASGDFAGIAAQTLEQQTGAPALFLNGASGNITPIIGRGSSYAATCALGQSVAQAVTNINFQDLGDLGGLDELDVSLPSSASLPLGCHY